MSQASTVVDLSTLSTLEAKEQELREAKRRLQAAKERREWEAKTKARNPRYVVGSVRKASAEDEAQLSHCHGEVATILCEICGKERVVNKQDAFQVRFCKEHKAEARKAISKAKRAEKRLEGKSVEDIEAQIAALNEQLEQLG